MKSFSASALIETLTNQGCRIWVTGDRLRIFDPEQAMTDELRQAILEHKTELIALLRADAPKWITERNLNPESVSQVWQAYLAEAHGGQLPALPQGTLLSQFNLWLEAHGQRPTTLPVLRKALGMHGRAENPPATIARCPACGGTAWGPSGRHTPSGCGVWHCLPGARWRPDDLGLQQRCFSMTTPKQLTANRQNARKSTGPKTPQGKAAVRHNAVTHGLLSREVLLPEEDEGARILVRGGLA